ncbi:MAG: glycoside hydrolase family 130 protein [bacterium]
MVPIYRKPLRIFPDAKRVVARYFVPGGENRIQSVVDHVLKLSPEQVKKNLQQVLAQYSDRHRSITHILLKNFERIVVDGQLNKNLVEKLSQQQRLLLGAYFTMEYSIEAAAFFNPSIVEDPDQSGTTAGEKKVILSFRAVGEGHISSLVFRDGILDKKNNLKFIKSRNSTVDMPEKIERHVYEKDKFIQKMREMELPEKICELAEKKLKDTFIYGELQDCLEKCATNGQLSESDQTRLPHVNWLAKSHYEITFSMDTAISERVIFPVSYRETKGIEDCRFVRFVDEAGEVAYYATYTAYNGFAILPKIIETKDFYKFKVSPVHGPNVQNKGLALFPRKIKGQYAMLSRIDGINNYLMYSKDVSVWPEKAVRIQEPEQPWEFVQIGNCGSPVETPEGWLLITHGVGPMRQYCLGAILLDLENPAKVIGKLKEPLIVPNEDEREGYVPNVVYSCGNIIHNDDLVIPYGMSDYCSTYAVVPLKKLMKELKK